MRTTLIVLSIAALLAIGAGSAFANPNEPGASAPGHAAAARNAALQHRYVGRDLIAVAPGPQADVTPLRRASAAPSAPVAEPGFSWGDAMIGAGLLAALLALSAGVVRMRRHRPLAAR